jgi:hypothetical protein
VLSASEDRTLRVLRRDTGACVAVAHGTSAFMSVTTTDTQVAAGDEAGNVWLFDLFLPAAEDT